jgi:thiol:disulfide interchange protein DsbA
MSLFRFFVVAAALLIGTPAFAQSAPVPGEDYVELKPPQATGAPGKIEVTEFFWYRCPHCYTLEPVLEQWLKRLPKDAQFKRVPAIFSDDWAIDARIYYTLDALGQLDKLHKPLFDAIHQEGGGRLKGEPYSKWVAAWVAKQGIDPKKYDEVFRSFAVSANVRRASQLTQAHQFDGVPAIAVQGRYVVKASANMLRVTDFLISQVRDQQAAAKK